MIEDQGFVGEKLRCWRDYGDLLSPHCSYHYATMKLHAPSTGSTVAYLATSLRSHFISLDDPSLINTWKQCPMDRSFSRGNIVERLVGRSGNFFPDENGSRERRSICFGCKHMKTAICKGFLPGQLPVKMSVDETGMWLELRESAAKMVTETSGPESAVHRC